MLRVKVSNFLATVMLVCLALPLHGHAVLVSAVPSVSEVMNGPDVPVKLQFNARVDAKRSRIILVTPNSEQLTLPISEKSPVDGLVSEAKGLTAGAYILRWQVLANDGHITRGEVHFRVLQK
jgi:methionine-rich copper-binding protein CopC